MATGALLRAGAGRLRRVGIDKTGGADRRSHSYSPGRRVYADDDLSFNPWHCLAVHQPLGSIQRVRRPVYEDSDADRHRLNDRPRCEPESIDELPA